MKLSKEEFMELWDKMPKEVKILNWRIWVCLKAYTEWGVPKNHVLEALESLNG